MAPELVRTYFKDLSNPPVKRRTRIRQMSRRQRRRLDAWAEVGRQLAAAGRVRCEACDVHHLPECNGRFEHKHHMHRRSQGGADVIENCLPVSDVHHEWIHRNVGKARALGFLRGES
jgi:hypothetical protein